MTTKLGFHATQCLGQRQLFRVFLLVDQERPLQPEATWYCRYPRNTRCTSRVNTSLYAVPRELVQGVFPCRSHRVVPCQICFVRAGTRVHTGALRVQPSRTHLHAQADDRFLCVHLAGTCLLMRPPVLLPLSPPLGAHRHLGPEVSLLPQADGRSLRLREHGRSLHAQCHPTQDFEAPRAFLVSCLRLVCPCFALRRHPDAM
mmetsp:Transcript_60625/g.161100  ORF Transcript_60625/g.161100 Transcript_60625/m.161100 type:complete len:202 (+) Transcript_60625:769-1374(+)